MKTAKEQFLDDVIITAVEGGINYWAYVHDYTWSDEGPTSVRVIDSEALKCEICDADLFDNRGPAEIFLGPAFVSGDDGTHTPNHEHQPISVLVDRARIEEAFDIIKDFSKDVGWNEVDRKRAIGAYALNDASDIDASDADCILQIALFGSVVCG